MSFTITEGVSRKDSVYAEAKTPSEILTTKTARSHNNIASPTTYE